MTRDPQPHLIRYPRCSTNSRSPTGDPDRSSETELFSYYRTTEASWSAANQKIDDLLKDWPYGPTTLALDLRSQLRPTRIFRRGTGRTRVIRLKQELLCASSLPKGAPESPRTGDGITDRANPLTARIIVNRVWQQLFGQGLVRLKTLAPGVIHPSPRITSDWLAVRFRDGQETSIAPKVSKQLVRTVVTSATYRQSSEITGDQKRSPSIVGCLISPRVRVDSELVGM